MAKKDIKKVLQDIDEHMKDPEYVRAAYEFILEHTT